MDNRKLKKQREAAAKLSRPRPVELPSGRWRCQVMVNGKRIDVIEDDPAVAHAKALAVKAGLLEEEKSPRDMTVGQAIDRYIESKDAVLSPSTIRGYTILRKGILEELSAARLDDLTQEAVQRFINRIARTHSPKTVRNAHGLLSAALALYRPEMVLRTTLPQKEKKEISIPSMEEIQFLAEKIRGTRFELPFLLAAWMGLRTSEIRGLTWDCIEGDVLHIKQALVSASDNTQFMKSTNTYSGNRKIRIPPYILDLIKRQPRSGDYIVTYRRNSLYACLQRLCAKYNLPHYRFHDLRHVQASVMLLLNVPDKYAMERMGHASNSMLKNVYQHTMKKKSEEVADIIDTYFEEQLHTDLHMDVDRY